MTKDEILQKYGIPPDVLDEYHQWDLCEEVKRVMGVWQYDDGDLVTKVGKHAPACDQRPRI